jgi:hypothetical protein
MPHSEKVVLLNAGRVEEQGHYSFPAFFESPMTDLSGDPRFLAAEEGTAFSQLLIAVDGGVQ